MKKIVFIAGGSGYIGKNLIEGLGEKYRLLAPTRSELNLTDTQAVENFLAANKVDVIINCAAAGVSRSDSKTTDVVERNSRIFINLSRCHKLYGKMIFLGSGAEYDKSRDLVRVPETEFNHSVPQDAYGFSKYLSSLLIENLPNAVNLRLFAVFGKYEKYFSRFISNVICRSLLGLKVTIIQDVKFDYFSVTDLVRVVDYFIVNNVREKFYNVGSGQGITLTEIVKKVEKLSGHELKVEIKTPGLAKEYTGDNSRLLVEMSDFKFSNFDSELEALYNWYAAHINEIDKDLLMFDK